MTVKWLSWVMKICPKFQVPFPHLYDMINFLFPNSRALLPTFRTNCPDGSHFFQIGTHFAQNTTTNPCSLLSSHTLLLGICTYTKKAPPQNTPFSGLILKVGKWTIVWAKWTATGQNVSKVGKTFLEVGNFFYIHYMMLMTFSMSTERKVSNLCSMI